MGKQATINRFETGISENNLKHWGVLEAVKELVQNVVYAKTILGNDIEIKHNGTHAIMSNTPSGFSKGKLLIGESEQSDVAGAPGQYGEGMKVAMSVARRCGMEVMVETNGFTVRPELEPSSLDETVKVLVFYVEDNDWNGGTRFTIECEESVLDEAKSYFAVLNNISEEDTKMDTVLENVQDTVFVNGVKIAELNSVLSYNFTDPELMNRDRSSVDMAKVKKQVNNMLTHLKDPSLAAIVLQCIMDDDTLLEAQAGIDYYYSDYSVWREAASVVFEDDKVAIGTGGDSDTKARYHKFKVLTNVPQNWKYFFNAGLKIPFTDQLEEVAEKPKNIHRKPSAEENTTLGWAKRLIKLYYGDYGTVKVSETVYDSFGNEMLGLYDRATDTTWLKKSLLDSKEDTFKTLLHETIHRVTGATDNTAEFTRAWEDTCWKILQRGK